VGGLFRGDPQAAEAAHRRLTSGGQLRQEEQLGLSVALTPAEFRCGHYGDSRVCPYCAGDRAREVREERRREREDRAEVEGLEGRLEAASVARQPVAGAQSGAPLHPGAREPLREPRRRKRVTRQEMTEILEGLILDEKTNATAKCTAIRTLLELKKDEPLSEGDDLYEGWEPRLKRVRATGPEGRRQRLRGGVPQLPATDDLAAAQPVAPVGLHAISAGATPD
jgi:hypothetical protein